MDLRGGLGEGFSFLLVVNERGRQREHLAGPKRAFPECEDPSWSRDDTEFVWRDEAGWLVIGSQRWSCAFGRVEG